MSQSGSHEYPTQPILSGGITAHTSRTCRRAGYSHSEYAPCPGPSGGSLNPLLGSTLAIACGVFVGTAKGRVPEALRGRQSAKDRWEVLSSGNGSAVIAHGSVGCWALHSFIAGSDSAPHGCSHGHRPTGLVLCAPPRHAAMPFPSRPLTSKLLPAATWTVLFGSLGLRLSTNFVTG